MMCRINVDPYIGVIYGYRENGQEKEHPKTYNCMGTLVEVRG